MCHIVFSQDVSTSLICIKMFIFYEPQGEFISVTESTLCSTIEFSVWMSVFFKKKESGIPNNSAQGKWNLLEQSLLFVDCLAGVYKKKSFHSNWPTADILLQWYINLRCSPIAPSLFVFFSFGQNVWFAGLIKPDFCSAQFLAFLWDLTSGYLSCGLGFGKKMPGFSEVPTLHWKERMQIW